MIKQLLPKSLLLTLALFSLLASVGVNVHANFSNSTSAAAQQELLQQQREEAAAQNTQRTLPLPDITVLGRVVDLIHQFTPRY